MVDEVGEEVDEEVGGEDGGEDEEGWRRGRWEWTCFRVRGGVGLVDGGEGIWILDAGDGGGCGGR